MRGPGWQIDEGFGRLRETLVFKRLRTIEPTDIPWADDALLAAALTEAANLAGPYRRVVAYPAGFDINPLLDARLGPMALRLRIPGLWYRRIYASLGGPPSFLATTTADVRDSGWGTGCVKCARSGQTFRELAENNALNASQWSRPALNQRQIACRRSYTCRTHGRRVSRVSNDAGQATGGLQSRTSAPTLSTSLSACGFACAARPWA